MHGRTVCNLPFTVLNDQKWNWSKEGAGGVVKREDGRGMSSDQGTVLVPVATRKGPKGKEWGTLCVRDVVSPSKKGGDGPEGTERGEWPWGNIGTWRRRKEGVSQSGGGYLKVDAVTK